MITAEPHPNPQARIQVQNIGLEKQPVLILDDFLLNPSWLIEDAAIRADFAPDPGQYPGHRARAPEAYTRALEQALPGLLNQVFGTRNGDIRRVDSSYALVTQEPHTLQPLQRIPHVDSKNPIELASIYFLCNRNGENYGGTAFYRQRSTGFEQVDAARFDRYRQSLEADARQGYMPEPDYIRGDTPLFEQIARFEAVFNRILIYRCTSLHSGDIAPDFNFSDQNPRTARLSINSFLGV